MALSDSPLTSFPLWQDKVPEALGDEAVDRPQLTVYPADPDKATGAGVIVLPGGGYRFLSMEHEGHAIGQWLQSLGVSAFVLEYRLPENGYRHPVPLMDAQRAIRLVRSRAKDWDLNPQRLGILGFSAGGHLASTAATHYNSDIAAPAFSDTIDQKSARPDFQILIYPVITMDPAYAHPGSRANLLGPDPDSALEQLLSSELQVQADAPPAFIVHASDDSVVPVENALRYYRALQEQGVAAEMHIYPSGGHGFGTRPEAGRAATWTELCEAWLKEL
ncbi:MAG: alpha/beta hydrolase [Opitutales bacterium]|nr:alpha/beta hydrolase [Opitutales bacterium]